MRPVTAVSHISGVAVVAVAGCAQIFGIEEGVPAGGGGGEQGSTAESSSGTTMSAGSESTTSSGDGGATPGCVDPSVDCELPPSECQVAVCQAAACALENVAPGVEVDDPAAGDCRHTECDGDGNLVPDAPDDTDLPTADANSCTVEGCESGNPATTNAARNVPCTFADGTICDGDGVCLNTGWANWRMPNGAADVAAGAPNPMSYTDHGDGTVTDDVTGLMWQQDVDAEGYDWDSARAYCDDLDLAGSTDWRLPSRVELMSILDLDASTPAIRLDAFPGAPSDFFWSATREASSAVDAWIVDFGYGQAFPEEDGAGVRVRCVR